MTRRRFLQATGGASAGLAAGLPLDSVQAQGTPPPTAAFETPRAEAAVPGVEGGRPVTLRVNGVAHAMRLEPRVTLLDALREVLLLTGTKKGCDRGQCGACTVLVDGRRINACLTLAMMAEGSEITTIEGLGTPQALHPMQAAFIERDAFQCGYCTPGQICSAVALVSEWQTGQASAVTFDATASASARDTAATNAAAPGGTASASASATGTATGTGRRPIPISDAEIAERMSGNLCRCGAYTNIVAAVRSVVEAQVPVPAA